MTLTKTKFNNNLVLVRVTKNNLHYKKTHNNLYILFN